MTADRQGALSASADTAQGMSEGRGRGGQVPPDRRAYVSHLSAIMWVIVARQRPLWDTKASPSGTPLRCFGKIPHGAM